MAVSPSSESRIRYSKLVFDESVFPRQGIDGFHIDMLAQVLQAGKKLPPILVEEGSNRVVDGFHRSKAHRRVFGEEAEISAVFDSYASDAELFVAAVQANIHGKLLSPFDRAHVFERAKVFGVIEVVMDTLGVREHKMEDLGHRKTVFAPDGKPVLIRAGLRHMAGTMLSEEQVREAASIGGQQPGYLVRQLETLLRTGMMPTDGRTIIGLRQLEATLATWLQEFET